MSKRRIMWAIGLLLSILLFYSWIPVGTYSQMPIIFSIIGAALFLFFLTQLIGDFHSWEELNTKDKSLQDWRHKYTPLLILPTIVWLIVLLMHVSTNETAELKKYGVKTKGYIKDGSGFKSRRGGMYDITIEFKDEKGHWLTVKKDVGESEFKSYGKGQQVMLIYSKKHPNILEILSSDAAIEEYTGIKGREFEIKDLTTILSMKRERVDSFLNTISYPWVKHDSDWVNERKYQYIKLSHKTGTVTYVSGAVDYRRWHQLFKQGNFQEVDSTDKSMHKLYYNDSLFASVELLTAKSNMILSSVSIRKKHTETGKKHG